MVKYSRLTIEELELFGASFPSLSEYSIKASINDEIVGFIALENNPLILKPSDKDCEAKRQYKLQFNNHKSYYLRLIKISQIHRYDSTLEDMFDYMVHKLPHFSIIWCRPSIWDRNGYITQIGGFNPIPMDISTALIFSIDV